MFSTNKKNNSFLLFFFVLSFYHFTSAFAQGTDTIHHDYDTNYYRGYDDKFIFSVYQSANNYTMDISQFMGSDVKGISHPVFEADADLTTGFEIDYDVISLSLDIKSKPPDDVLHKGKSSYNNFAFSFGGNKWSLETSYRSYKGFYDKNTPSYDTSFKTNPTYYQDPNMNIWGFRAKLFYFFNNKKFSFKSAYTANYRQLKSAASWILVTNFYYNSFSTDSSFFPRPVQPYYGTLADLRDLNVLGYSICGGFSANIVLWKALFANFTADIGPELQRRAYGHLGGETAYRTYVSGAGDFRAGFGLNNKNFFMSVSAVFDSYSVKSGQMKLQNTYYYGSFSIGYRFKMRPPKIYQKFQKTKIYSYF